MPEALPDRADRCSTSSSRFPACVVNARLDLLAYNRVYASFHDDLESMPIEDRNLLWLAFTSRRMP